MLATARTQLAEHRRADALAALDRAKTVFFTNVSHEFRTPLTLIDAPLRELADEPGLDPAIGDRVALALRASGRLRRLVNTLLEFSQIESGTSAAGIASIDLGEVVRDVAGVFQSAFESAGLYLRVVGDGPARPVLADPEMLERILLNLVSNALKFTADGGVELRLGSEDEHAVLAVVDTGVGIGPSDVERVFDRFARVESGWSRSREGSGIGLALAAELTRLQEGTLTVTSEVGVGSTFTLRLPLGSGTTHRDPAGGARASGVRRRGVRMGRGVPEPTAAGQSRPTRAGRILIADDNADMRGYLQRLLGRQWATRSVSDGEAALESIVGDPPDLVLADVMMPRLDGLELVARIRGTPELAGLPVILLSARAGDEARAEGLAGGADDYLVKPFSATDLVARIASQLERQDARRRSSEALRISEARWRGLIEGIPNPIATLGTDGADHLRQSRLARVPGRGAAGAARVGMAAPRPRRRPVTSGRGVDGRGRPGSRLRDRRSRPTCRRAPSLDEPAMYRRSRTRPKRRRAGSRSRAMSTTSASRTRPGRPSWACSRTSCGRRSPRSTPHRCSSTGRPRATRRRSDPSPPTWARRPIACGGWSTTSSSSRTSTGARAWSAMTRCSSSGSSTGSSARRPPGTPSDASTSCVEGDLPPVSGDDGYVEQILRNLLSNAAKYGDGGADHGRDTRRGPGEHEVTIAVRDRGPGFVDGDEDRVFDLFYRGDTASRRAAGIRHRPVRGPCARDRDGREGGGANPSGGRGAGQRHPVHRGLTH